MDTNNTAPQPDQEQSQTPIEPIQSTPQHIEEVLKEDATVQKPAVKKHRKFGVSKTNIFIVISLLVILGIGVFGYMLLNPQAFPFMRTFLGKANIIQQTEPEPTPTEPAPVEPLPDNSPKPDADGNFEYISNNYEFAIKYPAKTKFVTPGAFNTPLETYQIFYKGTNQPEEILGAENLNDGYIVTITVHKDIINTNIDQIALEKRNRFLIDCPDTAQISPITDRTISNRVGKTFSVDNCGVNYVVSFIIRDTKLFEFNQIYRGDLGFRQVYRNESDGVVSMFRLINTIEPTPVNTWTTYTNASNFSFKHPAGLDTTCCTVKGPLTGSPRKLVVFADPRTLQGTESSQFNGLGIYVDTSEDNISYDDYITNQKRLLEENYRVVIGRNPITSSEEITVNGVRITILRGYAWWGDFAIFEAPATGTGASGSDIVVFIKTEVDKESFEATFLEILNTIELKER